MSHTLEWVLFRVPRNPIAFVGCFPLLSTLHTSKALLFDADAQPPVLIFVAHNPPSLTVSSPTLAGTQSSMPSGHALLCVVALFLARCAAAQAQVPSSGQTPVLLLSQRILPGNDPSVSPAALRVNGVAASTAGGYFNDFVDALGPTGDMATVAGAPATHVYSRLNTVNEYAHPDGTFEFFYVVNSTAAAPAGASLDTSGSNFNHWRV